ncbi:MAG: hypothetical protein IT376_03140 [Polyangiaceae bacterium]|nr:hypothetical protein [Polyangiaceae bacterium]
MAPSTPPRRAAAIAELAAALGLGALAGACAPGAARAPRIPAGDSPGALPTPARVLPSTSLTGAELALPGGDVPVGATWVRVALRPDGSLWRSDEVWPTQRAPRWMPLPDRLGGGVLFHVAGEGETQLWRAESFTAALAPLGRLPLETDLPVAGFDRLLFTERASGEVLGVDAQTGAYVGPGSLPAAAAYRELVFADAWHGAVEVPLLGALLTFDAGRTWHQPPGLASGPSLADGTITLLTARGRVAVARDGALTPIGDGAVPAPQLGHHAEWAPPRPARPAWRPPEDSLGRVPLEQALRRGWPERGGTVLVARAGTLTRLRLADGKVLERRAGALPGTTECAAVPWGAGMGFLCEAGGGATALYAFVPPLGAALAHRWEDARAVAPGETGALAVRGGCAPRARPGAYCVLAPGNERELIIRGDPGAERVVALAGGRAAVLEPPRLGASGRITVIRGDGATRTVGLSFPGHAAEDWPLVQRGLWLDSATESPAHGAVHAWIAGGDEFVGVRIELATGRAILGRRQRGLPHAVFSGPRVLVAEPGRTVRESVDGGFTVREVDHPGGGPAAAAANPRGGPVERGCSRAGCALGGWLRIGWQGSSEEPDGRPAPVPQPITRPAPAVGRWSLRCHSTGEVSPEPLPVAEVRESDDESPVRVGLPRPPSLRWRAVQVPSPTQPFAELAPPSVGASDVVLSFGTTWPSQVRGYAWAPPGADWTRAGKVVVRVADRFRAVGGAWSSGPSRSPWASLEAARQAFGDDPLAGTSWTPLVDAGGHGALVFVHSRGNVDVLRVEEGRSVDAVHGLNAQGLLSATSAARISGGWYAAGLFGTTHFVVARLRGRTAERVADFDLSLGERRRAIPATLVRSTGGDRLGVWLAATRTRSVGTTWYVHPLDPATGEAGDPLVVEGEALREAPRVCAPDDSGFLLVGELPIAPRVTFESAAEGLTVRAITARLIVGAGGVCVDAVAARAERLVPAGAARSSVAEVARWARGAPTVPLVVDAGRRWGFRCVAE